MAFRLGTQAKFMQSLKNIKNLQLQDAKSSWAKPSSQSVNLPGAQPLIKPLSNIEIDKSQSTCRALDSILDCRGGRHH